MELEEETSSFNLSKFWWMSERLSKNKSQRQYNLGAWVNIEIDIREINLEINDNVFYSLRY